MSRLLDYVREHAAPRHEEASFAYIARRLEASSAVMTNWKVRGISKDGALKAQRVFGCNARWVMTGEGPPSVETHGFSDDALQIAEIYDLLVDCDPELAVVLLARATSLDPRAKVHGLPVAPKMPNAHRTRPEPEPKRTPSRSK